MAMVQKGRHCNCHRAQTQDRSMCQIQLQSRSEHSRTPRALLANVFRCLATPALMLLLAVRPPAWCSVRLLCLPVQGLAALKQQYGFLLVIDDAHATLVCGPQGGGAAEMMGVSQHVDVHVGTLSKAFGSLGGFVACSSQLRALLLNRGRSVIYSTALPVPVVAAARAALRASRRWGGKAEGAQPRHLALQMHQHSVRRSASFLPMSWAYVMWYACITALVLSCVRS